MKHYFKRRWDESRGDEFNAWGCSLWLIEADEEYWPVRQIEIYDGGQVLFYDREHLNDEYGGLGDQPLDPDEFEEFRISAGEFEFEWTAQKAINRV